MKSLIIFDRQMTFEQYFPLSIHRHKFPGLEQFFIDSELYYVFLLLYYDNYKNKKYPYDQNKMFENIYKYFNENIKYAARVSRICDK